MIQFKTQYEKLVLAYMSDKVIPMNACACFVGNLLNRSGSWLIFKKAITDFVPEPDLKYAASEIAIESDNSYTPKEILQMEGLFMTTWRKYGKNEDSLFKAFERTLLLLRKIHESKGEVIDDYVFKKRNKKKKPLPGVAPF